MSRGAASRSAGTNDAGALAVRLGRGIQRSITAFLVAIIVLPGVSLWATYQIRTLSARIVSVEESRLLSQRILRYALDEESSVRAYVATGQTLFLEPYNTGHTGIGALLKILPARFTQSGLQAAVPYLKDFARLHTIWHQTVAHPLLADPHRGNAPALEAAGKRLVDAMKADAVAIQAAGTQRVQQTTREMTDVIAASVALAAAWLVLVAIFTVLLQRRAVSSENRLVETIVHEREEVQHLSDWRSRLLAMLAHDFKSQLTVLIGASHLLEDFPVRRGDPELLASLRNASYSLAEMADNAILLARAQERKIVLQRSTFDVADVVGAVVQRYGPERAFNVLQGMGTPFIDGDRSYVARVMDNIIGNAVKYSDKPIDVRIQDEGLFVCVSVIDRGMGISEQDLPHIFEEFWRSDRTSWKRSGSGVGLFIVKTIMEAHSGDIGVESLFGHGTTVTLKFPRALPVIKPSELPAVPA